MEIKLAETIKVHPVFSNYDSKRYSVQAGKFQTSVYEYYAGFVNLFHSRHYDSAEEAAESAIRHLKSI